jgi:hypothetical protein
MGAGCVVALFHVHLTSPDGNRYRYTMRPCLSRVTVIRSGRSGQMALTRPDVSRSISAYALPRNIRCPCCADRISIAVSSGFGKSCRTDHSGCCVSSSFFPFDARITLTGK